MSRWWRGLAVAIQAQAYQRWPLEPLAGGADLPAPLVLQQRRDRLRAGQLGARGQGEGEVRRHPQHVGLAAGLEELAQLGAVAVDLVAAGEVEAGSRRRAASVQMSMASCPLVRNSRSSGSPMTRDFTGSSMCSRGIHCRAPISACPVPSRTYDRCTVLIPLATRPAHPRYWRLTPAVASPAFSCPVSSIAPITIPPRRPRRAAASSPADREPAHHAHRGEGVPARVVQQPLRPVRRPVPAMPGDTPPVHPGQLAGQRRHVLARLQPRLGPGKTRPQQAQQLIPFPQRQPGAYPDGSGRL